MSTAEDRGLTKLTAKFFEPMFVDFDLQLSKSLIRRDAFLDRMIWQEIPHLSEDLKGKRLSNEANRYISRSLKGLGGKKAPPLKQVSFAIKHETSEALRAVVEKHNLVRDAFLNRLITLLRASDNLLRSLDLPTEVEWARNDGTEDVPTSPLRTIEYTLADPFFYLRAACHKRHGCGLHVLELPIQYAGFYCYLDDQDIPGTDSFKEREAATNLLLADLDDFESNLTPV